MKKIVYIERDDNYAIILSNDSMNGVAVQVVMYVNQLTPDPNGMLVNVRNTQVVDCSTISLGGDDFKERVKKQLAHSKHYLASLRKGSVEIEGVMNDYRSQFRNINEDEKEK